MKVLLTIFLVICVATARHHKNQALLGDTDKNPIDLPTPPTEAFGELLENDSTFRPLADYLYHQLDFNENGTLNYKEFFSAVGYVCGWYDVVPPHPKDIRNIFDQIDNEEGSQGELSEDEFFAGLKKLGKYIQIVRSDTGEFHLDYDKDAKLDGEYTKDFPNALILEALLSGHEKTEKLLSYMVDRSFAAFDLNGNGKLGIQEAILGIAYTCGQWDLDVPSYFEIQRVFNENDVDGDEELSHEEFHNLYIDLLQYTLHQKKLTDCENKHNKNFRPKRDETQEEKNARIESFLQTNTEWIAIVTSVIDGITGFFCGISGFC